MHAIAEIVIPPNTDIADAVAQMMNHFKERDDDDNIDENATADWWDFYVIGGRFSGNKLMASLDPDAIERFYAVMKERSVTVSGLQCGKQELSPASQIPMVDALWRDHFPGCGE